MILEMHGNAPAPKWNISLPDNFMTRKLSSFGSLEQGNGKI